MLCTKNSSGLQVAFKDLWFNAHCMSSHKHLGMCSLVFFSQMMNVLVKNHKAFQTLSGYRSQGLRNWVVFVGHSVLLGQGTENGSKPDLEMIIAMRMAHFMTCWKVKKSCFYPRHSSWVAPCTLCSLPLIPKERPHLLLLKKHALIQTCYFVPAGRRREIKMWAQLP